MFTYNLELAVRSLRRRPGLTGLMILAIAFGVAASMTTYSVFRGLSADPIRGSHHTCLCRKSMRGGRSTAKMASRLRR